MNATLSRPKASAVSCRHCATPFQPTEREDQFCCSGCRFVFHLLHKRGLEDFYRYGETLTPIGTGVFQDRDWDWLRALQSETEKAATDGAPELTLEVQGISCAGCIWLLEAVFREHPGAISAEVNSSFGTIRLRWKVGGCDLPAFARDAGSFGYSLGAAGNKPPTTMRPLVRKLGLCGALALNAMLFALPHYLGLQPGEAFASLFQTLSFVIATSSVLIGGTYFFRRAVVALRQGELHIDLPISVGLAVAYAGSLLAWQTGHASFAYFDFVAIFTFLMLLGRWLQERAVEQNRNRLLANRLAPDHVQVLRNGLETSAPAASLVAGERFWLKRGQLVPVRARLLSRPGVFAMNWINGEPEPRTFSPGGIVASGARSLTSEVLEFLALENWPQSQLATLLSLEAKNGWRNEGLQRLIRVYLTFVLTVAVIGFGAWGLIGGNWLAAVQVLVSVLVVSCPCAIGVALPLLDDVAAARLQQCGVYLREASLWQRIHKVKTILFDKTGTITLEDLMPANPGDIDALPPRAQSVLLLLVSDSLHPIATSLRGHLLARGIEPASPNSSPAREITGMGIEWEGPEGSWRLGRSGWATENSQPKQSAGTVLSLQGNEMAKLRFQEEVRPDARRLIRSLQEKGLGIAIVSGDAPARVHAMAKSLGLPEQCGHGGLTPQEKADLVTSRWPGSALMLGDGANDSLAFDAALCRGTPSVDTGLIEYKADFYLLGRSLAGLGELLAVSDLHRRASRAVFGFAISYNTLAVSASLAGWMNPLVAAVIMPLSSLISIGLVFSLIKSQPTTL